MPNQPNQKNEDQSRLRKSKILRIVLSGLLAFVLWFYVISVERTETEQRFTNVEVRFDGEEVLEDRGLKLNSDTDMTVEIRLNGRRSVLNSLRSSDLTVYVDLTRIYEAGTKTLPYEIQYPGDVNSGEIEVVSRKPDTITVTVESWAEKRVNLRAPLITGTPAEGYRVGSPVVQEHETVKLVGPKEVIDQIQYAGVTVNVDGVTESLGNRYGFVYYDIDGNEIDGAKVKATPDKTLVQVPILKEKTVGLSIPLSVDESLTKGTEFTMQVTVEMSDGTLNHFEGVVLAENGTVSLSGSHLRQDEDGQVYMDLGDIIVFGSPNTVGYVTEGELPDLVLSEETEVTYTRQDVDLRQDEMDCNVKSVTVSVSVREKTKLFIQGVKINGIDPEHTSDKTVLSVLLEGFQEDLNQVTADKVYAEVAQKVTKTGTYTVTITLQDCPGVTVVKEYQVKITVPELVQTIGPSGTNNGGGVEI